MKAGAEKRRKKAWRGLQGITRNPYRCNPDAHPSPPPGRRSREIPDENRQRDPRGYRPLFHICMHVVIPPLENSSRSGNRFEFERCTNVSRINSFHRQDIFSRRTRRYLLRALEYWIDDDDRIKRFIYIYIFSFEAKFGLIERVIVNCICEHRGCNKLSLMTNVHVVFLQHRI